MKISPSIMCADLMNVESAVRGIEAGGAASIHVDIMDGRFVPGFTFGADFVRQLGARTGLPLDIHLMSATPADHIGQYLALSIDSLIVHVEAEGETADILAEIRSKGRRAGIALNPDTPIAKVEKFLPQVDIALVMTVHPGFIGQAQSAPCVLKASNLVERLGALGYGHVEVVGDGGVKPENIRGLVDAGVHRAVSGTGVFRPDMTPQAALALFRKRIAAAASDAMSIGPAPRQTSPRGSTLARHVAE
jgi:ribulose-phosphate 3-epimerase